MVASWVFVYIGSVNAQGESSIVYEYLESTLLVSKKKLRGLDGVGTFRAPAQGRLDFSIAFYSNIIHTKISITYTLFYEKSLPHIIQTEEGKNKMLFSLMTATLS